MPKSGRPMLGGLVLCVIPIHAMMALDIPQKVIKAMTKICRGFLWCAKDKANGGNAWWPGMASVSPNGYEASDCPT